MKQIILKEKLYIDQNLELRDEQFHYLNNVRRIKLGDKINFLCETGERYLGQLIEVKDNSLIFKIIQQLENDKIDNFNLTLFQCLPKGKKMEQIIRQASEAGVKTVVPVQSEHAVPLFKNLADFEKKRIRWQKIAQEAAQQSGSSSILKIADLVQIHKINAVNYDICLYAHASTEAKTLHSSLVNCGENIAILIGPEGGLSINDRLILDRANFFPVYLGQSILRVENAGIFLLGAVKMILLEKDNWRIN